MKWLRAGAIRFAAAVASAPSRGAGILDAHVTKAPDPQNALDIFAGEWASRFPPPFDSLTSGTALAFDDARLQWALERLGGARDLRVLELGPLEGGHTYMLDRAGATSVLAIESNTRAYLKCLIAKELLGLRSGQFVCGDFVSYLRGSPGPFDLVVASGVLYHLVDPVEVLARIAGLTDRLYVWTHYYDAGILEGSPASAYRVVDGRDATYAGFSHKLYRHDYLAALNHAGFCGGSKPYSYWLTRDDILGALRHLGFDDIETGFEQPDHPNGPAFAVVARRRR